MCARQRRAAEEDDVITDDLGQSSKEVTDDVVSLDLLLVRAKALGNDRTVLC
jgi:hypothetical protein